eukprot:TRINITY_DN34333_c0_g2_i1.p1 TRINITY_DN34333_c0_g2~~TRINITY_DN34333_c0_g2_i1.p1  ORF type:complete len:130 (+),score=6.30 TRINITY_DN34333_c0_g2_i1:77-466(+)
MEGIDILLYFKHGLGWEGTVQCAGYPQEYVNNGMFLGSFYCFDRTIGGQHKIDPDYHWVTTNMTIYIVGASLGMFVVMVFVGLIICKCLPESPYSPSAITNEIEHSTGHSQDDDTQGSGEKKERSGERS